MRVGVLLAVVMLALPAGATGTFPGPNGRLVFVQWTFPTDRFDQPRAFICSSEPDGSAQSRLTDSLPGSARDGWPAFSPDGARFVFTHGGFTEQGTLTVAGADGSGQTPLSQRSLWWPSWSADGRRVYAFSGTDIVALSWPGGAEAFLTSTTDRVELYPVASPDGTRLAYVETAAAAVEPRTLMVADLDARGARPLVTRTEIRDPDWAPDASRIVFGGGDGIWEVAVDGGSLRRLRATGTEPAYSPDGSRIAFADSGDIWTMTRDGGDVRRVTDTPVFEQQPAWQQRSAPVRAAGTAPCAITGTEGHDELVGSDGPDLFLDLGGDDVLRGLGGDDVVVDGPGDDRIDGGDGDDVILLRADGRNSVVAGEGADQVRALILNVTLADAQTIDGGPGDDRLMGSRSGDRLLGGEGADVIHGLRGPDTIFAGPGNDRVDGGLGDDVLFGGRISGLPPAYDGYDVLLGRGGNDRLAGGWQKDRLFGGPGADRLAGGPHADYLQGENGRDELTGETGDDLLLARDGEPDRVFGGPGFDRAMVDGRDRTGGLERLIG